MNEFDVDTQLLLARQAARIGELETWLGLLIVRHGTQTSTGWQYRLCDAHALLARRELPRPMVSLSIDYDVAAGDHLLDIV